jgi:hypothetical protein
VQREFWGERAVFLANDTGAIEYTYAEKNKFNLYFT